MIERLFTYGTLQEASIQLRLFGRVIEGRAAVMRGYKRAQIRLGEVYFVAVPAENEEIAGQVLELSPEELHRCDVYEGAAYLRERGHLSDGSLVWIYRNNPAFNSPIFD